MRNLASCVALCTALAMPLVVTPAVSAQQTSAAPSSAAAAASTSAAAPASAEPSAAATSAAKAAEEQGSNGSSLSSDSGLQPNTNATPGANFTGQKSQIEENPLGFFPRTSLRIRRGLGIWIGILSTRIPRVVNGWWLWLLLPRR